VTAVADAHVGVAPAQAPVGAAQRYDVLVPGEKAPPTTRVEVQFPASLSVTEIESVPGWRATLQHDASGRIVGVVWDGGAIAQGRFVRFGVLARNPPSPADLAWNVIQSYADGSEAQWTGASGAQFPAPVTRVQRRGLTTRASTLVAVVALLLAGAASAAAVLAWRRALAR
jgi:uncharacterized protein YcnI